MKPTTTDDIIDLIDGYATSAALGAAMELGLFWLLAERPLTAPEVAQALGMPARRCQYWLDLLSSVGLIEQAAHGYAPSAIARSTILDVYSQETWAFLAREARERYPAVQNLARHIQGSGSTWEVQGLTPPNYFAQISENPERARAFTRMLYEIHLPLADALAESLDMNGVTRLLDLGGGSGVVSIALLRRHPQLTAVVVDIANVCVAGREIAAENAMGERITYHAADFLRDELPSGFDMVLQCDVGAFSEEVLAKLRAALHPGGRFVIVDLLAPTKEVTPRAWLYWAFLASLVNREFTLSTTAEIQARLTQAGFELLSEWNLPPSEVLRWSDDWIVIEARKRSE